MLSHPELQTPNAHSRSAAKRVFQYRDDHPSVTRKSDGKKTIEIPSELSIGSYYDPLLQH
ncbi:hypothetical protein F5887DRAFT_1078091 [Amanita rubescens]|nr:hypothetical protein F5887DRAFT_1078091 [Amanita rubescens]